VFQLSREDVEALESNAVEVIPKLLARSFVRSQQMLLEQMGRTVPAMLGKQVNDLRQNAAGEQKFYTRWPQLRPHADLVRRLSVTYRQMNKQATLDQMIEELGPIVMMTAKVPMVAPAAGQPQNPMQPQPARPANGVAPPQPSPFVPGMGGGGQSPQQAQELSDFESMFLHPDA